MNQKEIDDQEAIIRKNLEQQLGVEFCSPEELKKEDKIAKLEKQEQPKQERPQLSVSDIISRCNDAGSKMSAKNPNKILMYLCASALRQMVDRLSYYERQLEAQKLSKVN